MTNEELTKEVEDLKCRVQILETFRLRWNEFFNILYKKMQSVDDKINREGK